MSAVLLEPPATTTATTAAAVPAAQAKRARGAALVPAAFIGLVLGCTALQRFGLTLGSASLNAAHFGAYALLAAALFSGRLALNAARMVTLCALLSLAGLSWVVNETWGANGASSPTSFILLALMYLPFVFMVRPAAAAGGAGVFSDIDTDIDSEWILRVFANVGLFCAFAGIMQFVAQFVIRGDWLFDFSPYLPPFLRSSGGYNTVIPVGNGLFKSNGFLFKEPSLFSLAMAFALLVEIGRFRRWLRMAVLVAALLLTYSGSGLVVLAVGLLFPLRARTFARLGVVALIAGLAALALWDVLNLDFTLGRLEEFGRPRTSAHQRYVAPMQLIIDSITREPWTLWIGYGPGTIYRTGTAWAWFYEYHDPTLAKLLFEYGLLGLLLAVALAVLMLRNPSIPLQVRAATFFCWIATGGFLLTPELTYLMIVFGNVFVPARAPAAEAPATVEASTTLDGAASAAPLVQAAPAGLRHTSHGASPRA